MSRNLDSPVRTQMAVSALSRTLGGEHPANQKGHDGGRQAAAWKRVFVQTETGSVMGIELNRGDNAHTVKRKLHLALNVPIEDSSLTFGDRVLKNDLSVVRNDSALLLTRNFLHRSSSTPCLSPTGKDASHRDRSGPIEILGCAVICPQMKQLVKDVVQAVKSGVDPFPVDGGMGGTYYFRNSKGEKAAIVKPTDEEPFAPNNPKGFVGKALGQPGLKRSVRVGETGFREVAAYLLDHGHSANVPPTILVKITHAVFHMNAAVDSDVKGHICGKTPQAVSKIASFQQYIRHDFDASDHGTSSYPVSAVHRIGILDVRIFNTDRHAGNLLVRRSCGGGAAAGQFAAQMELIPIDHGLCLPESLEDPYFEWIHWPQASIPFSDDELEYISSLDPAKDCELLRAELPMIRKACLRVLVLSTLFLKEAAAFGLCLAEIGDMMTRQFTGRDEEPSELEVICIEARKFISERAPFSPRAEAGDENSTQFDIDCEEDDMPPASLCELPHLLSRLDESLEDGDGDGHENEEAEAFFAQHHTSRFHPISKLSTSLKGLSLADKLKSSLARDSTKRVGGGTLLHGHNWRSANEQLPSSACFVKLGDMSDLSWAAFLDKFQEMLPGAFRRRKFSTARQRQKQRMGTSCQF